MRPSQAGRRRLLAWLDAEPVRYAHVIQLLHSAESEVHVDNDTRPRSVLVFHVEMGRIAAASEPPEALGNLLEALPAGEYLATSLELDLLPVLEARMEVTSHRPVWLFRMQKEDLRPFRGPETEPVKIADAPQIAKAWRPERDATDYVRHRIQEGISSGIYLDGTLVAWDMTHFETDKVVMLGFLHVMEAYRGRGYAKAVTTATVEKVFAKGKIPAAEVFQNNTPSMRLTEGMGFRRVRPGFWGEAFKA